MYNDQCYKVHQFQSYSLHSNLGAHQEWEKSQWSKCYYSRYVWAHQAVFSAAKKAPTSIGDEDLSNFACSPCPPGEYQNDSKYSQPTKCKQYTWLLQENSSAVNCAACPAGYEQGKAAKAFCLPCFPGKYQNQVGRARCKVCEAGRYKAELKSTTECKLCPPGTSRDSSEDRADCIPCSPEMEQCYWRTTTQFVETALLVGTHLPLVCQKNLVASSSRKGNLVKKAATLHQLRDARTAIRAIQRR